ncbi:hypothetical protein ABK040_010312 [Willaertia magna]
MEELIKSISVSLKQSREWIFNALTATELLYKDTSEHHSKENSNNNSFIFRPAFIVSLVIIAIVLLSCVGILIFRYIVRRRRRNNESTATSLNIKSKKRKRPKWILSLFQNTEDDEVMINASTTTNSTSEDFEEESLPLYSKTFIPEIYSTFNLDYNNERKPIVSIKEEEKHSSFFSFFKQKFTGRKKRQVNDDEEDTFHVGKELLFQATLFLRSTDYEPLQSEELKLLQKNLKNNFKFPKNTKIKKYIYCKNSNLINTERIKEKKEKLKYGLVVFTDCKEEKTHLIQTQEDEAHFCQLMLNIGKLSPFISKVTHVDYSIVNKHCYLLRKWKCDNGILLKDLIENLRKNQQVISSQIISLDSDIISQLIGQIICSLKTLQLIGMEFTHLSSNNILLYEVYNEETNATSFTCKLIDIEDEFILPNTKPTPSKNSVESLGFVLYEMCTGLPVKTKSELNLSLVSNVSFQRILQEIFPVTSNEAI